MDRLYFNKMVSKMNEDEKNEFIKVCGSIIVLGEGEGRSVKYMTEKLNLDFRQLYDLRDQIIYTFIKRAGLKRVLKILFMK